MRRAKLAVIAAVCSAAAAPLAGCRIERHRSGDSSMTSVQRALPLPRRDGVRRDGGTSSSLARPSAPSERPSGLS